MPYIKKGKIKNNGFTLVEMSVSLGIFSLVVILAIGIFVSGSSSQRKAKELYNTQREGGYLIETISRELRMAVGISSTDSDNQDSSGNNIGQQNNSNSSIEFTNYNKDLVKYCRSDVSGACTENDSGDYLSYNGDVISSSNVKITFLRFYVSESFSQTQPIITINMRVKSTGRHNTKFVLQNSVAMRIY
ncbi:MAG: prepilin-type N-terminal cleavage/methylation domain-containing protein [Patescibacteria group bacterium]|nr:prepilin-type N-terminal cleavage/methylation domain-containing protein [Patescibacteria group bacterium]